MVLGGLFQDSPVGSRMRVRLATHKRPFFPWIQDRRPLLFTSLHESLEVRAALSVFHRDDLDYRSSQDPTPLVQSH